MNLLAPAALALLLGTGKSAAGVETGGPTPANPGLSAATNNPAELSKLEAADDAASAEVERWQREFNELKTKGAAVSETELQGRIAARLDPVRKGYEAYLDGHPFDARAHLLYGGFLNDRQDEQGAQVQWEKALALDPTNAAVYNNLAGRYAETGPANKVFEYFAKAIELGPSEPAYYHNFGDSLYVLRKHAGTYYHIDEQQVYGKAVLMYSNACALAPRNYNFARDLAQTYYSLKPFPVETALTAWTNALRVAREETDRAEATLHLARVNMLGGRYAEARAQLDTVTNEASLKAKTNLLHNLNEREKQSH